MQLCPCQKQTQHHKHAHPLEQTCPSNRYSCILSQAARFSGLLVLLQKRHYYKQPFSKADSPLRKHALF